jgi:glycosyltransferase involved in cell wall biosynthesis
MEGDRAQAVVTPPRHAPPHRILFVMLQMGMGGSERLVLDLVKRLDRRQFEPSVAWFGGEALPEFTDLRVPLHHVPKAKRFDWQAMRALGRIAKAHRIDLVNAHHFMSFVYASYAAVVARARLVYTEHSEADVLSAGVKWTPIGHGLLQAADAAVGVSGAVSRAIVSRFRTSPAKVHTIENGVDLDRFGDRGGRPSVSRDTFGFSNDDLVIGHVANFRHNKNHLFLVRAFRELAKRHAHVRLVLVGQGFEGDPENSEPEVRRFVLEHGLGASVRMLGYRADVHDVLRLLDVFCLVSRKEGLPLSLIEAMAAGLPVVGTDIEGIRQALTPEVNGLAVAPDDVGGLTDALERLVRDARLRRRLGAASRRAAVQRFSLDRCVGQTEQLFRSVLTRAPAMARSHAALSPAAPRRFEDTTQ